MKKSIPADVKARHKAKMLRKADWRRGWPSGVAPRATFGFPSKAAAKGGCPKPWTQEREAARRLRQMEARAQ